MQKRRLRVLTANGMQPGDSAITALLGQAGYQVEWISGSDPQALLEERPSGDFALTGDGLAVAAASSDRRELRRVNAELRYKIRELEQANAGLEQFAFTASHDLKEPLRIIASYTQLLVQRQTFLDEETREFTHYIVDGVERMRSLIDALLAYSRLMHQPLEAGVAADAAVAAASALQTLRAATDECAASVEIAPLPAAQIDLQALTQVFQNLIANALKYRRPGVPPVIQLSAAVNNGEVRFAVGDNGIGIKTENYQVIFELFRRLHGEEVPGLGIGLAMCQRMIQRYGGRIWLESKPGTGSTFYFTLRAAKKSSAGSEQRG